MYQRWHRRLLPPDIALEVCAMDRGDQAAAGAEVRVLLGDQDDPSAPHATSPRESAAPQGDLPARGCGADQGAADSRPSAFPDWAVPQLDAAVAIVHRAQDSGERQHVAAVLHRDWFCPSVGRAGEVLRAGRPLAGLYRSAHAGSTRQRAGEVEIVRRHDVIGGDGWWRTWGESWTPPRSRPGSIRLLLTPRPDALADVVRLITGALLDSSQPWLLACATDPRRLRRTGGVVLDLADLADLTPATLDELVPLLRHVAPPLCLPVAPGIALAEFPDNGMTFGETQLVENYAAALDEVLRAKPSSAKGRYLKKVTVSTTMGPGIPVDPNRTRNLTVDEPTA
jgi:hypothetical protein